MIVIATRQGPVFEAHDPAVRLFDVQIVRRMRKRLQIKRDRVLERNRAALARRPIHHTADVWVAVAIGSAVPRAIDQLIGVGHRIVTAVSPENGGLGRNVDLRLERVVDLDEMDGELNIPFIARRIGATGR